MLRAASVATIEAERNSDPWSTMRTSGAPEAWPVELEWLSVVLRPALKFLVLGQDGMSQSLHDRDPRRWNEGNREAQHHLREVIDEHGEPRPAENDASFHDHDVKRCMVGLDLCKRISP